ncbi:hypothetical protein [Intestinibacter sp.]
MRKYSYYLKVADIFIKINIPFQIKVQNESVDFICNETYYDISIDFIEIEERLNIEGELVNKEIINIYKIGHNFIHELYPCPEKPPYAWLIKIDQFNYEVRYLKGYEKYLSCSRNILEAISIEKILNRKNAFILHSSFIKWKNRAILFSAPSGTGKSTQADLWNKYENAEIINGDKAGLRKTDDKWMAYGLPFAGSSNIFKNKKACISNIIILRQGKENKLKRLSPREAFIKIYSETTVHAWDKEFQENIVNMIIDLVQQVPIYLYECLPDKSAVDYLKQMLEEGD